MATLTQPPQIAILNRTSNLIDIIIGVDSSLGVADAFKPVILNQDGVLDPLLTGTGVIANASASLAAGSLVNLYNVGSVLTARPASANNATNFPATGFVVDGFATNDPATVYLTGRFNYLDLGSLFTSSDIGSEVYLSATTPGAITKVAPTPPNADQIVGYVISFQSGAPNIVTVSFGTGVRNFAQIDGVCQINQGGTSATTAPAALTNLLAGSYAINQVLASPASGGPGNITLRGLVAADLTGATFGASGGSHSAGAVPDPGAVAGSVRFLNENATFIVPPTFIASGPSHAPGYVPDPGAVAGTTKFLREDATFAIPTGAPGGSPTQIQYNLAGAFAGITGSSVTAAGAVALAPTGTGLALKITGDAAGSDIQQWWSTTVPGMVAFVDQYGNTKIQPATGGSVAALSIVGESGGIEDMLSITSGTLGGSLTVQQSPATEIFVQLVTSGGTATAGLFGNAFTMSDNVGDFSEIGVHSGNTGGSNAPSLVVYCHPTTGQQTTPFAAANFWGDRFSNNILNCNVSGTAITGGTPAVSVDSVGTLHSRKGVSYNLTTKVTTYAATATDHTINCNGTFTLTLPTVGLTDGQEFYIKNIGVGVITVSSAVNIDFALTQTLSTQGQSITVQWDATAGQFWIY